MANSDSLRSLQIGELIWKQTVALFPQLRDCVEYFDVGTPVTNRYYIRANKGEMYGLDHNKEVRRRKLFAYLRNRF